jgi:hypothetical protein
MPFPHIKLPPVAVPVLLAIGLAHSEPAAFDLAGPSIEVEITRGSRSLPASQVPNLAVGDRVWIKADLSPGQSARYLMVATFLRGATDPPPADWFSRCETWRSKCSKEGLTLTVPHGAQQLLVFLAPQTGGDFNTLVNAVRGRPGAFVRTSQDLNQAGLDRSRLETYLTAVRSLGETNPSRLREAAPLLARSLAIKVDEKCLEKISVLQAPCLAEGRESLILDDGHSVSIAQQLTSGPTSDLAMEASNTPQLRSGYYGPFIGSIFDIAKILDSFGTAQYQYFPALTSAHGRSLDLTLNAPPSFHDPKSVLVVALPAMEAPQFPPLHSVNPEETLCARKDLLVLPVQGAPLVFSTAYAHDSVLHFLDKDGSTFDLSARADPTRGGFVVESTALNTLLLHNPVKASLHGQWGFDAFEGPSFQLANPSEQQWSLGAGDATGLIVGRPDTIHLHADSVSCLEEVTLVGPGAQQWKVEWKKTGAKEVEARLPLQEVNPGDMTLLIKQFGGREPRRLSLRAFSVAGHLERFALHAGDSEGVLHGNRLDEVESLTFQGTKYAPGTLSSSDGRDELAMLAEDGRAARALRQGDTPKASATLKDGRVFEVGVSVDSQRPSAAIISKTVKLLRAAGDNDIRLSDERELPLQAELTFSLRAESPPLFTREDKLEVATTNGASSVVLGVGAGGVMLQSAKVAVATLDPEKAFGASAFGPLRLRRIIGGVPGGWQPLVTLVRLPSLTGVDCPADPAAACSLVGGNLFLLDSVSRDAKFTQPTAIPDGFTDPTLLIPHPTDGQLYIKLRDDPSVVSIAVLTVRTRPSALTQTVESASAPALAAPTPGPVPASEVRHFSAAAPAGESSAYNAAASADSNQQPPKTAAPGSPSHEQP